MKNYAKLAIISSIFLSSIASIIPAKADMRETLCRQGNFLKRQFSLRSGEGAACGLNIEMAAAALVICEGVGDFDKSHCAKNAKERLGGLSPKEVLKKGLAAIAKLPPEVKKGLQEKNIPVS